MEKPYSVITIPPERDMTQQWISVKDRLPEVEYGNAEQFIVNSHVPTAPYNLERLADIDFEKDEQKLSNENGFPLDAITGPSRLSPRFRPRILRHSLFL